MKQPNEDIAPGTWRDDLILSLGDGAMVHRKALCALAYHLYDACLVGNQSPKVRSIYERITKPQPGDLVVEWMIDRIKPQEHRHLGILLEKRTEWWDTDEDWQRQVDEAKAEDYTLGERPVDEAWYIQYGPSPKDICRWTNCSFIVVPTGRDAFDPAPQPTTPEATSTSITREDIVFQLNDSGFELKQS